MRNDNADAKVQIDDTLIELNIPPSLFFLTNEIINYGMDKWINKDRSLIVNVNVEVFVDELPPEQYEEYEGEDCRDDDENDVSSDILIEKLEKVQIEDDEDLCSICLDDYMSFDDLGVTELPCTHIYHEKCMVKWLQISKVCPLCRYELA